MTYKDCPKCLGARRIRVRRNVYVPCSECSRPTKATNQRKAREALEVWSQRPLEDRKSFGCQSAIRMAQAAGLSETKIDNILSGTQVASD